MVTRMDTSAQWAISWSEMQKKGFNVDLVFLNVLVCRVLRLRHTERFRLLARKQTVNKQQNKINLSEQ